MTRLLILGGGTAGTVVANSLRRRHSRQELEITVVDRDNAHRYQPGYLFLPFTRRDGASALVRSRRRLLRAGITTVTGEIDHILPEDNAVTLTDGRRLDYDYLVIATGTTPRPDQTPGMLGPLWRTKIFDFYSYDGARALREAWRRFEGGRLVVHITDTPIKCPVAPMEFTFLADADLRRRGRRGDTEITYVTPLSGAFTKPVASRHLGSMLESRAIALEPDFLAESIDTDAQELVSYDERRIPFDLLVTVPLNMGADFIARSGLGDELNYVDVDPGTLRSTRYENIYALGDAGNIPTSKAGSVAHFAAEVFTANFSAILRGQPGTERFDGHANCFIESGRGKALLIDFTYEIEPLPGRYPLRRLGPMRLLGESRINHWGKLAFRWVYWHLLLPGRPIPLPAPERPAPESPTAESPAPESPAPESPATERTLTS